MWALNRTTQEIVFSFHPHRGETFYQGIFLKIGLTQRVILASFNVPDPIFRSMIGNHRVSSSFSQFLWTITTILYLQCVFLIVIVHLVIFECFRIGVSKLNVYVIWMTKIYRVSKEVAFLLKLGTTTKTRHNLIKPYLL